MLGRRLLAPELAGSQVQINAVVPGIVDPPLHPTEPQTRAALQALAPAGVSAARR
ncbi:MULTISPECIES: hypothetical protein [Pseudomonas]|uniref:Uncharacterized protein n=1 Tax=Pseudomonas sessilinigenes TaxID=658629 RepID=A0ABX8MW84_9PSED|nr:MULTISPECIES: hypothetical protein [Pseudomonas]AZC23891.1 hypothetical protein C4K39_2217 [Pseudomonas sessilinigenes]QXH42867.1 hypothetical protein KSS89_11820 [Pseudomonas sessilinigenes]